MAVGEALGRLADLAEAQSGLVTTRQAQRLGVARRDLARLTVSGALERVGHGVYRVAGAPRPRLLELRTAWLQLAPGVPVDERRPEHGVISHDSAALVYQAGTLDPAGHEFTLPGSRRVRSRRGDVLLHRAPLSRTEVDWVDELLVTTPGRLVFDLCAARTDGDHLAEVISDLLAAGKAGRRDLTPAVAPYAETYGALPGDGAGFLTLLLEQAAKT